MALVSPLDALDPALAASGDVATFWRVPRYHGLDCLRATFRRHSYDRHTHETYAIAVIVGGCETFFHRGEQHYATPGMVAVVCPDEIHDGAPHDGGFVYRTFYPSASLMREIAEDVSGRSLTRPPWFSRSVVHDPELAADLAGLHACLHLNAAGTPELERDVRLVACLGRLILRWGDLDLTPPPARAGSAVARVRECLDARFAEDIGLDELARAAGVSRAHLIRAFRNEVGLTPHAYLVDRRFRAATRRLAAGEAPAEVAAAVGLFDQSHLNRVFKARMGVTPGTYRAA